MLIFDLVAGVLIAGALITILFVGIVQASRYQCELEAQRDRRVVTPVQSGQEELDEPVRRVVRTRRDDHLAACKSPAAAGRPAHEPGLLVAPSVSGSAQRPPPPPPPPIDGDPPGRLQVPQVELVERCPCRGRPRPRTTSISLLDGPAPRCRCPGR